MSKKIEDLIPAIAIHPGEILKDELDARSITQKEFAKEIGIAYTQLNEIIKGKRNITPDFAVILEATLEIDAQHWLSLQSLYELDKSRIKAKVKEKTALIERWKVIKKYTPVNYFKKLNLISGEPEADEPIIKEIYKAASLDDIIAKTSTPCCAKYRKSQVLEVSHINLVGWVRAVEFLAKKKEVKGFDPNAMDELINDIHKIFLSNNILDNLDKRLAISGIKFIVLQKPDKAPADGVSLMSNDNPVLAVSLRYKRLDNLAFTVFHELGHIYLHLPKDNNMEFVDVLFGEEKKHSGNADEVEADRFAQDRLIPPDEWRAYCRKSGKANTSSILNFANSLGIHPAIVIGRLKHDNPKLYKRKFDIPNTIE